jgi:hypothetical protein
MNKVFGSMVVLGAMTLSQSGFAVQAYGDYLAVCEGQLQAHYGDDTRVKLISSRKYPDGVRLKVATRVDDDNSRFATCWVSENDLIAWRNNQQQELVAGQNRVTPQSSAN